ncbi:hypothetical protein [Maricaulis sp.]|uniref:hypothetical protein n=1 Tax=Maricaulis sp. TaxID=1486257 RepID=UPI003A8ED8C3
MGRHVQDETDEAGTSPASGPGRAWLISASLVIIAFGVASSVMWEPAWRMLGGGGLPVPAAVFAVYSPCGPLAALLALVIGWLRFNGGQRGSALKWMIAIPVVWLIGLLGWLAALQAFCDGALVCAA